jgi:hypothetical protein
VPASGAQALVIGLTLGRRSRYKTGAQLFLKCTLCERAADEAALSYVPPLQLGEALFDPTAHQIIARRLRRQNALPVFEGGKLARLNQHFDLTAGALEFLHEIGDGQQPTIQGQILRPL